MPPVTVQLLQRFATAVHIPNLSQALCQGLLGPLLPIMCREAGLNDAVIGSIVAVGGFGRVAASVPGAYLSELVGPVRLILAAYVALAVASLVQVAVWSLASLYCFYLVSGVCIGLYFVARHQLLAAIVEPHERGRLMSLVGGAMRWGAVAAPVLAGVVIQFGGSRACMALQTPLLMIGAASMWISQKLRAVETKVRTARAAATAAGGGKSALQLLWQHRSPVLIVGLYACVMVMLRTGRRLVLPLVALNMGMSPAAVGAVVGAGSVVDASMFWVGGVVLDKWGRRAAAVPTPLFLAIAYLCLSFANSTVTFVLCVFLFGASESAGSGLLLTLLADVAPPDSGSSFFGVLRTLQDSGTVIGPVLIGLLMHHYSTAVTCYALAGCAVVSAIIAAVGAPFSPNFGYGHASSGKATSGGTAFAALPDDDIEDDEADEPIEMIGASPADGRRRRRRAGSTVSSSGAHSATHTDAEEREDLAGRRGSVDSVDLSLDDDDLALFNAVHPGVRAAASEQDHAHL